MQHQLQARGEDWEAGALPREDLGEKLQGCSLQLQLLMEDGRWKLTQPPQHNFIQHVWLTGLQSC